MTKVGKINVKCANCGEESEQFVVFSVNFLLGSKEDNEELMKHMQKCPNCGYEAVDISKRENTESK